MTEAYDFIRILYAYLGTAYAPETGAKIVAISKEYVVDKLLSLPEISRPPKSSLRFFYENTFDELKNGSKSKGTSGIRLNGTDDELH